ncbi:MAG: lagellar hook-associated protein 1 FlgK [Gammaproteobacteria bacterium]|jgi:flagellar hook-associated protein 1 FlgK|nr:lagellar hook-associated protein 1 FlgK [Gammaproteobacteria bacterium]
MADFLSNGVSALLAFQKALDVTSQNISNVATPGYSRQSVSLVTNPPEQAGNGWIGTGVNVNTITRSYNEFLAAEVRSSSSTYQRSKEFSANATQVDNMFADSKTGLSATLQSFSSAVQNMANTPASTAPRQVVLSQAQALASQLQSYNGQLTTLGVQLESRVQTTASDISSIAQNIAKLNGEISNAQALNGQPPNDLLDQRDHLLTQLSADVNINVSQQGGSVNVYIGNGQPLVVGTVASTLGTAPNAYDPTRNDLVLKSANGSANVTSSMTGGTLGGMLDFRTQVLDPAQSTLGLISVGIANVVNQQQSAGVDLNGNAGQPIFAVGGVQVQTNANNAGSATLAVTRSTISALTGSNYILQDTAGGWKLSNAATGANVPLTGAGTSASPFQADGLSIVVSGTATVGDRFAIQPTTGATSGLNVLLTNPAQIAAGSPITAAAGTTNTGTATIAGGTVVNPSNAQLKTAATIQFLSATTYSINGTGSYAYTSGQPITANGWQVTVSGAPATGDTFTVGYTTANTGDNSNALKLAAVFNQPMLNGGKDSVNATLSSFIGNLGTVTKQAQNDSAAQQSVNSSATQSLSNVSGVNLDEEAANLLQFQQAYQAAAQLIGISSTLFTSILQAVRGQ